LLTHCFGHSESRAEGGSRRNWAGRKGKLLLLADKGKKLAPFDWPMLSQWQLPPRGMSNHLFTSADRGRTWDGPFLTDEVGGEHGYIIELSKGDLMYTRTDSHKRQKSSVPPLGA
jgi:hypothetical protein